MFQVKCIVDDRNLPAILRALGKLTFANPIVTPLADDTQSVTPKVRGPYRKKPKKRGEFRADGKRRLVGGRGAKGGGVGRLLRDYVNSSTKLNVSSKEMRKFAEAAGYGKGSYSHGIKLMLADGTLKALDTLGDYEIVRKNAA